MVVVLHFVATEGKSTDFVSDDGDDGDKDGDDDGDDGGNNNNKKIKNKKIKIIIQY